MGVGDVASQNVGQSLSVQSAVHWMAACDGEMADGDCDARCGGSCRR